MQNYCKTIGALAAASALAAGNATAIEIDYELSAGYTSEYLFRGFNLGQDLVDVELTAATEINGFGLSAGAWYASFDEATGVGGFGGALRNANANELNLFAEASYDLGLFEAAVGYIYYYYPQGAANKTLLGNFKADQEVYFSVAKSLGLVDASLTYYWLVSGADNDGYLDLAFSNSTELSSCLTLQSGLNFGYQTEKGKLGHITAQVGLDYALTETATVTPFIAHSWSTSENGIYAGTKNQFVAGARVAVSF
jgi:hypothetical protein